MTEHRNPFEFAGANDLPDAMVLDYYIEDFNYSRFLQSHRNIFLVGERGCGKSMSLIYNSWPIQRLKAVRDSKDVHFDRIGVYIPCKTPLIFKDEFELLTNSQAAALSEHFLVLSVLHAIADTLSASNQVLNGADEKELQSKLEYVLNVEFREHTPLLEAIKEYAQREVRITQQCINTKDTSEVEYADTLSFVSTVLPTLEILRSAPALSATHFLLMFDDAHDLNQFQIEAMSSWIAYRDHSIFSFKVAMANLSKHKLHTATGGSILEGHDYVRLDMTQPFHNEASDFGKHAERLVRRRLEKFKVDCSAEDFFPQSGRFIEDLEKSKEAVRELAMARYGDDSRRISDFVYKYARAHYFRDRSPKANRPEYSGFRTLVFLSTGVIRNLLVPCFWMYEKMLSNVADEERTGPPVTEIPSHVQSEVVIERSRDLWDCLRTGLDKSIVGCTRTDAVRCYQLLDNVAVHFRDRLLHHESEPRAISFTVSGKDDRQLEDLERLFEILREAQLLYKRSGVAKERGKREWYYVPNRQLWPERGLDPHGQHARVSLPVGALWAAAANNTPFPRLKDEKTGGTMELFDE